MEKFISDFKPHLMFVHFEDVDAAGHLTYWGSEFFYDEAKVSM